MTDGLSNTAYFSEKIRGNGTPNPKTDMLVFRQPDLARRHLSGVHAIECADGPAANQPPRDELDHGRDVLHVVQPRGPTQSDDLRGKPVPRQHGQHGHAGAPFEQSSRRSERFDGRCVRAVHQDYCRRADLAEPGYAQRWRGDLRRRVLIEQRSQDHELVHNDSASGHLLPCCRCVSLLAGCGSSHARFTPTFRRGPVFAGSGLDCLA